MVLNEITYYPVFGFPLILYGGVMTFTFLVLTSLIMFLNLRGITKIPVVWHHRMALLTLILALVHGSLGILAYV
jgi:hypothetical protein